MSPSTEHGAVRRYYSDAAEDYRYWGDTFNMHFGFWRWGMNPWRLEPMLERMTREVLERITTGLHADARVLDLGCGVGTPLRWAAEYYPHLEFTGVTVVPEQASQARRRALGSNAPTRIHCVAGDYTRLPFASETFDGAYAIESSCYAPGFSKQALIDEAGRALRPGARLVVADAFLKTARPMSAPVRRIYRELCTCWALDEWGNIHDFVRALGASGFEKVEVQNISRNVTPSVLHIPVAMCRFILREALPSRFRLSAVRWRHFLAGALLFLFALDRSRSGYFLVSAVRSG